MQKVTLFYVDRCRTFYHFLNVFFVIFPPRKNVLTFLFFSTFFSFVL